MNPIQKMLLTKIHKELPGYRQDRYRFYEDHPDFIKVIEVQFLNVGNGKKSFTIHYGIYVPILYEILWRQAKPKSIEASECVFFCNINSILNEFSGKPKVKYWDIDNLESLWGEITNLVKAQLYPFSQRINSLEELNSFINNTEYPGKYVATYPILNAVLKYVLKRYDEVEKLLDKIKAIDSGYFDKQIDEMNKRLIDRGFTIVE